MKSNTNFKSTEIIAALFILLFTYTAISKLATLSTFRIILSKSPWIGHHANLVSILLPPTELLAALLLFIPATRIYGLYASFILMGIFTGYIALMISFSSSLPCSCGGVLKHLSWRQHLSFNIFFLLLAITGILISKPNHLFIAINRRRRKPV